jgi:hypothetical protein
MVDFPTVIDDPVAMWRRSGVEVPDAVRLFGGAPRPVDRTAAEDQAFEIQLPSA